MRKKIKLIFVFFVAAAQFFCLDSCVSVKSSVPYYAEFEFFPDGNDLVLFFSFLNESKKSVEKVDFSVSLLQNENGESRETSLELPMEISVKPGKKFEDRFAYHDALSECDESEIPVVESFFAKKIYYSDGTVFEDFFGRYSE